MTVYGVRNRRPGHRLILPGKCGEFDLLADKEEEYDNRIAIGIFATGVFKPYSDWSDISTGGFR